MSSVVNDGASNARLLPNMKPGAPANQITVNVADLFEAAVCRTPDGEALTCGSRQLTFMQLDGRANQAARFFQRIGLGKGDHIGILGRNSVEWVEACLGAAKIRAVPIGMKYDLADDRLCQLINFLELKCLVVEGAYAPALAALMPQVPKVKACVVFGPTPTASAALGFDYRKKVAP